MPESESERVRLCGFSSGSPENLSGRAGLGQVSIERGIAGEAQEAPGRYSRRSACQCWEPCCLSSCCLHGRKRQRPGTIPDWPRLQAQARMRFSTRIRRLGLRLNGSIRLLAWCRRSAFLPSADGRQARPRAGPRFVAPWGRRAARPARPHRGRSQRARPGNHWDRTRSSRQASG
jgi:hypothetical protein